MKFTCLKALKSCVNSNKNGDYEQISYDEDRNEWRHSTQVDVLDDEGVFRRSRSSTTKVPDFDVYARTRTLIRQQTASLIQHGYYNETCENTVSSTSSSYASTSVSQCSCQMYFPSSAHSLATTTTFSSSSSSSTNSSCEFHSIDEGIVSENDEANEDNVFVCTYEFKSKVDGDLNIVLGERVRVVHRGKSSDYFLVRSLLTNNCGYVPRFCLTPLNP